jgi:hypothetical protein
LAVIERLWNDAKFEAETRRRALAEARRWDRFLQLTTDNGPRTPGASRA